METLSKKEIHYALLGNLLGDGYLRKNKADYHWVENSHTNKQREYVCWLEELYLSWGLLTKTRYDYTRQTNFGEYTYSDVRCKLQTNRHVEHNRLFTESGKKYVSKYVARRITPMGLLLWWLDDGHLSVTTKNKGSVARYGALATQGFDYTSQETIQKMFQDRFGISVKIYKAKDSHYIYFNATNFRLFYDLVREYLPSLPDSMKYKSDMKYSKGSNLDHYNLV